MISREVAEKEITSWLDYKKVSESKRVSHKDAVDTLIDAVSDGLLKFREADKALVHTLKWPTDGELPVKELEYKPRLSVNQVHVHLQGVKSTDADGRICAYVAALTSKSKEFIKKLDTEDYGISQSVAVFFL